VEQGIADEDQRHPKHQAEGKAGRQGDRGIEQAQVMIRMPQTESDPVLVIFQDEGGGQEGGHQDQKAEQWGQGEGVEEEKASQSRGAKELAKEEREAEGKEREG
jgi:hypothetical protein